MPKITIIKIIHFTIDFLLAGFHQFVVCELMKVDCGIFDSRHYSAKIDREKRQRACQAFWRSITKNGNRSDGRYRIRIIVRLAKQTAPTVELHFF